MHTSHRGHSLLEVGVILLLAFLLAAFMLPSFTRLRGNPTRSNCKNNQRQLMLACILYRDGQGREQDYPPADGSDFLIHLYASEEVSEPGLFICPSSGDSNGDGAKLVMGSGNGEAANACSYAGRRNRHPAYRVDGKNFAGRAASETPLSSDDDGPGNGAAIFNHEDAVIMGFLDGHVEEMALDDPRLGGATTIGEGMLDPLAN